MICRACGYQIPEGATFCPACGIYLTNMPPVREAPVHQVKAKPFRTSLLIPAVLLIAGVIMFTTVLDMDSNKVERSTTIGNTTLYGDMVDAPLAVQDGSLTYTGEGDITWQVLDLYGSAYVQSGSQYVERGYDTVAGPVLQFSGPGSHKVILSETDGRTYEGRVLLDGTITTTYTWSAKVLDQSHQFSTSYTFLFSDYQRYADDDVSRVMASSTHANRFIQTDPTMVALADALSASYASTMGQNASQTGQAYADYLLSFVQYAIAYPTPITSSVPHVSDDENGSGDLYLFGADEYWAYPLETMYHQSGDCEDTSFLLASLYVLSGYPCATVIIPGHMVVGVHLDSLVDWAKYVNYFSTVLNYGPYHLYACETTISYDKGDKNVPVSYIGEDIIADYKAVTGIHIHQPVVPSSG